MNKRKLITAIVISVVTFAICGDSVLFAEPHAVDRLASLERMSEEALLETISQHAPTIAKVILQDPTLRQQIGQAKFHNALAQVAWFLESEDPDCQKAAQIIGDTIPRMNARIGDIVIDGIAKEWKRIIPPPQSRTWPVQTKDHAREFWKHGVAGIVRNSRLYLLAGIEDIDYLKLPHNRINITVDCVGDPARDVALLISRNKGHWDGEYRYWPRNGKNIEPTTIQGLEVAASQIVEIGLGIDSFAPPSVAKPIWTINLRAMTHIEGQAMEPRTLDIPIFNETAVPGVAAEPYVRNLLFLAADVGLRESDLTAAAIAITSATIYVTSNDEVRRQLRRDNAELLRYAREIIDWQRDSRTEYQLDKYPLEAQLAWANRLQWLGLKYVSWNGRRYTPNDMENYRWSFVSVETLRKLRKIVVEEELIKPGISETAKAIDDWLRSKLAHPKWELLEERPDDRSVAGNAIRGYFKGKPVRELLARNTEAYLCAIRANGCFYGGCVDEAWLCLDLLQSVGIAPIGLGVKAAREKRVGHCWGGYYDPSSRRWKSAQPGRKGQHWWYFNTDRIAIYPSSATARRVDTQRIWDLFRPPIQGKTIAKYTHFGIPTKKIRNWMLLPCFSE